MVAPSHPRTDEPNDSPTRPPSDEHTQTGHHSSTITHPLPVNRSDLPLLALFNHPKTTDEWDQVDKDLSRLVVPNVLTASTMDEKNHALRVEIYDYFSTRPYLHFPLSHNTN